MGLGGREGESDLGPGLLKQGRSHRGKYLFLEMEVSRIGTGTGTKEIWGPGRETGWLGRGELDAAAGSEMREMRCDAMRAGENRRN